MDAQIYKICSRTDWEAAVTKGAYRGSADDARDGFIHFSTLEQLPETLRRHFAAQTDLVAAVVPTLALGDADLRWERSRGGDVFPHLYGALPTSAVRHVIALVDGADGIPGLPEGTSDA